MDKFFKNHLYRWTYDKLKKDPKRFGSDGANSLFMQTYLKEVIGIFVPISAIKTITSISRIKSEVLLDNPQYDSRVKDKPKKQKVKPLCSNESDGYIDDSEEKRSN